MTQRWRNGGTSYRPAGEPIDPRSVEVASISRAEAKAFVLAHHYSGTFPAEVASAGLYRRGGALVGVAVFSQPMAQTVLDIMPNGREDGVELGRFVLLDEVEANGETLFLRQAFAEMARCAGYRYVLAYADPVPRTDDDGQQIMPGHVGTIYQAHNGVYTGRGKPRVQWVLPSGRVFNARAKSKAKSGDRGHRYALAQLVAAGAPPAPAGCDMAAWVEFWMRRLCRPVRHPGNHRYLWGVDARAKRELARHLAGRGIPTNLPRPKAVEGA